MRVTGDTMRTTGKLAIYTLIAAVAAPAFAGVVPAVKNSRRILQSLVVATGVPATHPPIAAYYGGASSRLPRFGQASEVNAPMMLTFATLASLFCQEFIRRDADLPPAQRRAHSLIDFTRGPDAMTVAVRERTIEEYAELFFGRGPSAVERLLFLEEMDQLGAGQAPAPQLTRDILLATCTTVASSVDSLTY